MSGAERGARSRGPRLTVALAAAIAAVLVSTAVGAFFISVRGEEETQVPAIVGDDLLQAMEELQERGLVARVEGRFSTEAPAWRVTAQTPVAGSLVKAGRPVLVVVSRGRAVATVGDYVGRDVDEVRLALQTVSATGEPIGIAESGPRVSDTRPAGTILGQHPDPGTEISGEMTIRVQVSRGLQDDLDEVPHFVGTTWGEALAVLAARGQTFVFTVRAGDAETAPGTVVFQSPEGGTEAPQSTVLQVGMTRPEPAEPDHVFGLFEYEGEQRPIQVPLSLSAEIPGQPEPVVLLATRYRGGPLAIPFVAPADAELVLTVLGRQVQRRQADRIAID